MARCHAMTPNATPWQKYGSGGFEPTDDVEKGECLTINRLKNKRTGYGTGIFGGLESWWFGKLVIRKAGGLESW